MDGHYYLEYTTKPQQLHPDIVSIYYSPSVAVLARFPSLTLVTEVTTVGFVRVGVTLLPLFIRTDTICESTDRAFYPFHLIWVPGSVTVLAVLLVIHLRK